MKTPAQNVSSNMKRKATRPLNYESLEDRRLLATLLFDDFDPIDFTNVSLLRGARITGADQPNQYHDGNALRFDGGGERSVTFKPISIHSGEIEFRMRIGDSRGGGFENVDPSEHMVLEGKRPQDADFRLIHSFAGELDDYPQGPPWRLVTFPVTSDFGSTATEFRIRQLRFSGTSFDHWGIDDFKITGSSFLLQFEGLPTITNQAVDNVFLQFQEAIDDSSFELADLELLRNGTVVSFPNGTVLQSLGGERFELSGFGAVTGDAGSYRLRLLPQSVNSEAGDPLRGIAPASWRVDKTPPRAMDVIDVQPDPRTGANKLVPFVDVTFNEPIDIASFDVSDFTLTRDGGSNLLDSSVTISQLSKTSIRVAGLSPFTGVGGNYLFSLVGSFEDLAGNVGQNLRRDRWVANDPPILRLTGSLPLPEESAPRALALQAGVSDPDTPVFNGGRVDVRVRNPSSGDRLDVFDRPRNVTQISLDGDLVLHKNRQIGVITDRSGSTLSIELGARSTVEAVENLVRSLNYQFVGEVLNQETKVLEVTLQDGESALTSAMVTKEFRLQPVNDAPVLNANVTNHAYTLGDPPLPLLPTALVEDVDSAVMNNGSVIARVASGGDNTESFSLGGDLSIQGDELFFSTIKIGFVQAPGTGGRAMVLRFNEQATLGRVRSLLRHLQLSIPSEATVQDRTVEVTLRDGRGGTSAVNSILVAVSGTPQALLASASSATLPSSADDGSREDRNPLSGVQEVLFDVNRDGFVSALDALKLINAINLSQVAVQANEASIDQAILDVDLDGTLAARDALLVVNWLNARV